MFTWGAGARPHQVRQVSPRGVTQVHVHPSEEAMLLAWLQWLREADPDILNVFQVILINPGDFICLVQYTICLG